MHIRSVGIVGHGKFGSFLCELIARFAPEVEIRVYSRRHQPDGTCFFSLEDTAACDAVILTVPIHAFEENLVKTLSHIPPQSVIVDVATVKLHTLDMLKRHASGRRYIATHPMFGPESYRKQEKEVTGLRIVITEHTLQEDEHRAIAEVLRRLGFEVVHMSADQHDKHLAETLFLTHFLGQVISRAKFDRTEIDTVSFGYLMNAVESVKHDTKLFQDVYRFNPHCREVLDRFDISEREVRALLEK